MGKHKSKSDGEGYIVCLWYLIVIGFAIDIMQAIISFATKCWGILISKAIITISALTIYFALKIKKRGINYVNDLL